jgi:hypothetical protein
MAFINATELGDSRTRQAIVKFTAIAPRFLLAIHSGNKRCLPDSGHGAKTAIVLRVEPDEAPATALIRSSRNLLQPGPDFFEILVAEAQKPRHFFGKSSEYQVEN